MSIQDGVVFDDFKQVNPLSKKQNIGKNELKNYCPKYNISNLIFFIEDIRNGCNKLSP